MNLLKSFKNAKFLCTTVEMSSFKEFSMKYSYFVEFTLDNKYQHSEQNLINKLIDMPEVAWISSGRKTYVKKD